jgi:hypothetical protein
MEYQLVFGSSLEITPADFVTTWNEEASTQEVAQAELVPSPIKSFNGPVLDTVLLVANSVVLPIATNALYELIKSVVVKKKKNKHKHTKITQFDQPDGTHLLVIEEEG